MRGLIYRCCSILMESLFYAMCYVCTHQLYIFQQLYIKWGQFIRNVLFSFWKPFFPFTSDILLFLAAHPAGGFWLIKWVTLKCCNTPSPPQKHLRRTCPSVSQNPFFSPLRRSTSSYIFAVTLSWKKINMCCSWKFYNCWSKHFKLKLQ